MANFCCCGKDRNRSFDSSAPGGFQDFAPMRRKRTAANDLVCPGKHRVNGVLRLHELAVGAYRWLRICLYMLHQSHQKHIRPSDHPFTV